MNAISKTNNNGKGMYDTTNMPFSFMVFEQKAWDIFRSNVLDSLFFTNYGHNFTLPVFCEAQVFFADDTNTETNEANVEKTNVILVRRKNPQTSFYIYPRIGNMSLAEISITIQKATWITYSADKGFLYQGAPLPVKQIVKEIYGINTNDIEEYYWKKLELNVNRSAHNKGCMYVTRKVLNVLQSLNSFLELEGATLKYNVLMETVMKIKGKENEEYSAVVVLNTKKSLGTKIDFYTETAYCLDYDSETAKFMLLKNQVKLGKILAALGNDNDVVKLAVAAWNSYFVNSNLVNCLKLTTEIAEVYDMPHRDVGNLGNSCMINKGEYYHDLAHSVGNRLKIAYLTTTTITGEELLVGRALVWENVYFPALKERKTFMDRIYTINDNLTTLFKRYAYEQGWVIKHQQSNTCLYGFKYKGEYFFDANVRIELEHPLDPKHDQAPYMDTFRYLSKDCKYLANDEDEFCYSLDSTDGIISCPSVVCDYCSDIIILDDHSPEEYEYTVVVGVEDTETRILCSWCANEEYVYSQLHGAYILRNDAVRLENVDDYVHQDVTEINGKSIIYDEERQIFISRIK